jgi:hypothetical protein
MIGKNIDLIAVGFLLLVFGVFTHARHSLFLRAMPPPKIIMPSSFRPPITLVPPSLNLSWD